MVPGIVFLHNTEDNICTCVSKVSFRTLGHPLRGKIKIEEEEKTVFVRKRNDAQRRKKRGK